MGRPAPGFFTELTHAVGQPLDRDAAQRRLDFALAQLTDYDDSHPSLTDRLASLGQPAAPIAEETGPSAAQVFFGESLPSVIQELEAFYSTKMEPEWQAIERLRGEMETRRLELEKETEARPPTEEEAIEMAYLRGRFADPAEGIAIYRTLQEALPENAHAAFFLGQRLIEADDVAGIELLRFAAGKDRELANGARAMLAQYYARHGDHAAFSALREETTEAHDRQQVAERSSPLSLQDALEPIELTPEERRRLISSLANIKGMGRAYAVRKRLPGTGEMREYLFLIPKRLFLAREDEGERLAKRIVEGAVDLARPFVLSTQKKTKPWRKKLDAIPGALVFDHKAR